MEPKISIITIGVTDLKKSYDFYSSLGFETANTPDDGIVFFRTKGTCFALYPFDKLQEDIGTESISKPSYSGFTLAHNVREQKDVDTVIALAEQYGAQLIKKAAPTFWGGYSGYFACPEGVHWEVAFGAFEFNEDGSLKIP